MNDEPQQYLNDLDRRLWSAADLIEQELEARDYYTEQNVFWVPALARWDFLRASARVAAGTVLEVRSCTGPTVRSTASACCPH